MTSRPTSAAADVPAPAPASAAAPLVLGTVSTFLLLMLLTPLLPARNLLPTDVLLVDVASSFAPQAAVIAVLAALVMGWRRSWLRAASFLLLLLPDLYSFTVADVSAAAAMRPLGRVYSANLAQDGGAVLVAADDIARLRPDIVWLSEFPAELTSAQQARLVEIEQAYPYGLSWPATVDRSLKFLSRFPLRAREVFNPERAPGRPALRLLLDADGIPLTVFALHTHPPIAQWALGARNETLSWMAAQLPEGGNAVVIGDLNTSAFSPRFRSLIRSSPLACASPWSCAVGSWPAQLPLLLTPIDHVLGAGEVVVINRRRGSATGSDHYPVVAELGYRPPA